MSDPSPLTDLRARLQAASKARRSAESNFADAKKRLESALRAERELTRQMREAEFAASLKGASRMQGSSAHSARPSQSNASRTRGGEHTGVLVRCPSCGLTVSRSKRGGLMAHRERSRGQSWCAGGREPTLGQLNARKHSDPSAKVRVCPVCTRPAKLDRMGKVMAHTSRGDAQCEGVGREPRVLKKKKNSDLDGWVNGASAEIPGMIHGRQLNVRRGKRRI